MIDPISPCGVGSGRFSIVGAAHNKHNMNSINTKSNTAKTIKLVDDYAALNAQMKVLAELVDATKAKIIALGDGTHLGTLHKVVVSTSIPVRFDSSEFKSQYPDLYESFKKQGDAVTSARIHGR